MGCCASSDSSSPEKHTERRPLQYTNIYDRYPQVGATYHGEHGKRSTIGIGMGVAMVMQQAGALVGAPQPMFDVNSVQAQIRRAKAEGRTVTMVNGNLYFDYQLVARIPPNVDLRV